MVKDDSAISIDVIIQAPPEMVWKAWTEPSLVMKWFGSDPGGSGLSAVMDVRPGGYFEIAFRDADLTEHTCSGIYREVEPYKRLSFNWAWKAEPGVVSFVIVSLEDKGTGTNMRFDHLDTGTASKHDYVQGWNSTFLKLKKLITE